MADLDGDEEMTDLDGEGGMGGGWEDLGPARSEQLAMEEVEA